MIRLLVPVLAVLVTVFGTYAAAQYAKTRLRRWWHRRLTRRHGRMLQRTLPRPRGGDWYWPQPSTNAPVPAGRTAGGDPS